MDDQDSIPGRGSNGTLTSLFATASRPALGPTQTPIQCVRGALSPGIKRPVREADYSPPTSAEVKNAWNYTSTPLYVFMAWCLNKRYVLMAWCLVKHRNNFTFLYAGKLWVLKIGYDHFHLHSFWFIITVILTSHLTLHDIRRWYGDIKDI
jgi:hypothetical protein